MGRVKWREADELVSALQNDVDEIIFELRGEGKREITRIPWNFSGDLRSWKLVERMEMTERGLEIYGRGRRYLFAIDDLIDDDRVADVVANEIDKFVKEVGMEDYGN